MPIFKTLVFKKKMKILYIMPGKIVAIMVSSSPHKCNI